MRNQPPKLPVAVLGGGKPFKEGLLQIPISNPPVSYLRVRGVMNMIALAVGKNWIAEVNNDSTGKRAVQIRFFDQAKDVCHDVAKVTIELDEATSASR